VRPQEWFYWTVLPFESVEELLPEEVGAVGQDVGLASQDAPDSAQEIGQNLMRDFIRHILLLPRCLGVGSSLSWPSPRTGTSIRLYDQDRSERDPDQVDQID
jgi:hypothetical protein